MDENLKKQIDERLEAERYYERKKNIEDIKTCTLWFFWALAALTILFGFIVGIVLLTE